MNISEIDIIHGFIYAAECDSDYWVYICEEECFLRFIENQYDLSGYIGEVLSDGVDYPNSSNRGILWDDVMNDYFNVRNIQDYYNLKQK